MIDQRVAYGEASINKNIENLERSKKLYYYIFSQAIDHQMSHIEKLESLKKRILDNHEQSIKLLDDLVTRLN